MGNRVSADLAEQVERDLRISQRLERESLDQGDDIRFALAGLDFAGKKTIMRQLKAAYDAHYRQENPQQFIPLIHENIVAALKAVVAGLRRLHEYKVEQNRIIALERADAAIIAEKAAEEEAEAALLEDEDSDSSSEVTADTDEEEEAKAAAEEAKRQEEDEQNAAKEKAATEVAEKEAAAQAAKLAQAKARQNSSDSEAETSSDEDDDDSDGSAGGGGAGSAAVPEVEDGMQRVPDLKKLDNYIRVVEMYEDDEKISFEHVDVFMRLWNSWEVQETMRLRDVVQLRLRCDIAYFMERLEEVVSADYEPPHEAILRIPCAAELNSIDVRVIDHVKYTMIDLSPQRNKISKWLHLLSNLSSLIFVVAIDEFDISMDHDPTLNRITESAKLLRSIMENKALHSKDIAKFLWFNKIDSFSRKIKHVDIRDKSKRRFLDYEHGKCVCTDSLSKFGYRCSCKVQKRAIDYIREHFLSLIPKTRSQFRLQIVEGVDKYSVRTVFGTARDVMLKKAIYKLGDWV